MKRLLWLILLIATPSWAQYTSLQGFCQDGGKKVVTSGLTSVTTVQQSFPSCTINVFDAGTSNRSSIFANSAGAVKGNPFTAAVDGYWFFYGAPGAHYDVTFSGGTAPNTIATPFTIPDQVMGLPVTGLPGQYLRVNPQSQSKQLIYDNPPWVMSSDYVFTPQTLHTAMTAAMMVTETVAPVPIGVSGTDTDHWVYLSCNANSEAVLISGGSANQGGVTGTLQFTPANSHAANTCTMQTATAGVAEAAWAQASHTRMAIHIPCNGVSHFQAGVTFTHDMWVDVSGDTIPCEVGTDFAVGDTFHFKANGLGFSSIGKLTIRPGNAFKTSGAEIHTENSGFITDVLITSPFDAIWLQNVNQPILKGIQILGAAKHGIFMSRDIAGASGLNMTGAQISVDSGTAETDTAPLYIQNTATGGAVTTVLVSTSAFQGGHYNIKAVNGATSVTGEMQFSNIVIDSAKTASVHFDNLNSAGTVFGITFNGVRGGSTQPNVPIFDFDNAWDVNLNNLDINNSSSADGVILRGCLNCKVTNSTIGASAVQIHVSTSGSNVSKNLTFTNNHLGFLEGNQPVGTIGIQFTNAAHDIALIQGNTFQDTFSTSTLSIGGSATNVTICNNISGGLTGVCQKDAVLMTKTTTNGGEGLFLVNTPSTDYSSANLAVKGVLAITDATTNGTVVDIHGSDIISTHSGSGTTNPLSVLNDATLVANFGTNGGNGQLLVNTPSTDFTSTIFGVRGTVDIMTAATNAQILSFNASGGDGNNQIVSTKTGSGTTKPLEIFSDSTLVAKFTTNGGNGQFLLNTPSTDFSSGLLVTHGTAAVITGATDAQVLSMNASGGDGNSQIVSTKTGSGTAKPLELFVSSTDDIRIGDAADGVCVRVGSALRLLQVMAGAFIDGGACPF